MRFFHAYTSARLCRNRIVVLHSDGVPVYTHVSKECVFHTFYSELLGTREPTMHDFDLEVVLPPVPGLVCLDDPLREAEAKGALWSMHTDRSPSLDGFDLAFFRSFWPVVGKAVMHFLSTFHRGCTNMDAVNRAYVVLIPKKEVIMVATDFHPVSLKNCTPKIASKILTMRLKSHITALVSDLQTGFIQGRCITDNFLFAMKLV